MFNNLLLNFVNLLGKNLNDVIILFIALVAVYWYINYDLSKLANIKKSLRRLNEGIAGMDGYGTDNIQMLDDMFGNRMNGALRNAWAACHNDFRHIMNKEKTLDVREYFNVYTIITVPAGRKRAEAVPGILTMLGLLGTFLGIAASLPNLDFTNTAAAQGGMGSLMSTIAASFSISIAALVFSILFQVLDRRIYHSVVSELNMFHSLIGRKIPMASESGSLELLIREQKGHTAAIQKMGSDISAQLGVFINRELVPSIYRSFDQSIKSQIAPSIKSMSDMLKQLSEVALNAQTRGIQTMVDNFTDKLMSTMGLQFEKLGECIRSILDYQSQADENIGKLIFELSQSTGLQKEANIRTSDILETIGYYQQQASEINSLLAASMEGMSQFNETMRESLESDKKSINDLNAQRQVMREENSEYFGKMDEQIRHMLEDLSVQLDAAFSRFNEITSMAFDRLESSMNSSLEGISSNMRSLVDSMDDQVRDISIYAKGLSEEVGELNNRLENAVREFGNQMNEGVVKTLNTFDDGLGEICGRFGRVISDIHDAVEELPAMMSAVGNMADNGR